MLLTAAVDRAQQTGSGRKWLIILALVLVAVIGVTLGLTALQPHHVSAVVQASNASQRVTVTAHSNDAASTLAVIGALTGGVSALCAAGSMLIAFLAWRRPR